LAVFEDDLYFLWQSDGDMSVETDIHVVTYDGTKLSSERNLLPANNMAADENPVATVFEGKLYVAWNSNDAEITETGDDDIVIVHFDGEEWSEAEEVTSHDLSGHDHDGHAHGTAAQDKFPVMETYGGGLYVVWEQDDQRTTIVDPGDLKYRRTPPETDQLDLMVVLFLLFITIVLMAGLMLYMLGPKKSRRQDRYIKRREKDRLRRQAMSRAGGRKRSGGRRKRRKG
jgi:hypothetical protein